jgi:hypothetical protein
MDRKEIEQCFPGLSATSFTIQSPADPRYNCIAWAAGDTTRWWWPADPRTGAHWPVGVSREVSLAAFREVFARLGYEPCASDALEEGFEKVGLFARRDKPTHAARQLANGSWTSKLGHEEDIEHPLTALAGDTVYGEMVQILRRPVKRRD